MRISFLLHNAYGIGGTIRTTFNLAEALVPRHEVEIISILRHREEPNFSLDPRVRLRPLVDLRTERDDPRHLRPARVFPAAEYRYSQYSALTDERIAHCLATLEADVVIGTRPGLNVHLALQGPREAVLVGQEHLTLDNHPPGLRNEMRRVYPRLDALTTVTHADAATYQRKMRLPGVRVEALPNSVPPPALPPADPNAKIVVAAGRLVRVKRYDLLIRSFARVAAERPDWQLRIYGKGEERDRLRALINELGLYNNVFLMGAAPAMEAEWVKGSIGASTSSFEPFGMTLVEAMRCGLPVVSTDCPHGPAEIITPGKDGRLVPVGDQHALGEALLDLVQNDQLRASMSQGALVNSRRYDPVPIIEQAERLFTELHEVKASGRRRASLGARVGARLVNRGHLVRDAAFAAAVSTMRTVRRSNR
ncbi:Glycosyltransferase involved in cell wall bisynthesis [Streptomyces zhaozhouensis]|uniref:D-inositol 3-phosphate glycosyltransferase n=1 Tax=Streptomyces zhaozhouensis TaxID=1300267 RepID=A0A286DPS8_9ACTN|nr:glycosyltransferase family 4 protein [Streptomyces zhaozhouensis]SOD60697.1 Glycosyltransferase involved in cell wall bisynthesis [Streptomyces zhaozhouensis]